MEEASFVSNCLVNIIIYSILLDFFSFFEGPAVEPLSRAPNTVQAQHCVDS